MRTIWKYLVYFRGMIELRLFYNKHVSIAKAKQQSYASLQKELMHLDREYNRVHNAYLAELKK